MLADIDEKRGKINQAKQQQSTTETYGCKTYSPVMDLFLTFVYLEKHDEAWRVFEEYECPDKEAVRIEIKKYLSEDSLIS